MMKNANSPQTSSAAPVFAANPPAGHLRNASDVLAPAAAPGEFIAAIRSHVFACFVAPFDIVAVADMTKRADGQRAEDFFTPARKSAVTLFPPMLSRLPPAPSGPRLPGQKRGGYFLEAGSAP